MAYKYLGSKMVPLTHDFAMEFATMDTFIGERPEKAKRMKFLESRLSDGMFYAPRWAYAWFNGKKVRMNGQHSAKVLANSNGHFPIGLQAIVDEFECETDEDLADLFSHFDHRDSARSNSDIVGAHQKTVAGVRDIRTSYVDRLLSGIVYHMTGAYTDGARATVDERARLIRQYESYVKMFADIIKPKQVSGRVGCSGAMFATYIANKSESFTFWNLVVNETHPEADHPTRTLGKWLRETSLSGEHWTPRAYYSKCIHAWNAFRRGGSTNLKYHPKSPLPVAA